MEGRRERMQSRKQGGRAQSRPGSGSRPAATRNRAASLGEVTPPPKKKKKKIIFHEQFIKAQHSQMLKSQMFTFNITDVRGEGNAAKISSSTATEKCDCCAQSKVYLEEETINCPIAFKTQNSVNE